MRTFVTAKQMKEADRYTIEAEHIPSLTLMKRAAGCVAQAVQERFPAGTSVLVLCGSGNNGGDGFAAASILYRTGYDVTVCYPGDPDHRTEECRTMMEETQSLGIPILGLPDVASEYEVCLDALFGIGLTRPISGVYREILEWANTHTAYRIAVDISSGIMTDSGQVPGIAFQAHLTVTFAYPKPGHIRYPGKNFTGDLQVCDIGIHGEPDARSAYIRALDDETAALWLPKRPADANKGTCGKLLIIAGSKGMAGAAYLSALAAYRTGAGLVRILTHAENRTILQTLLPEAIVTTYETGEEALYLTSKWLPWATAVVCGPGLGVDETTEQLTRLVLRERTCPLILDADSLNVISGMTEAPDYSGSPVILTPHLKEFSRLSGLEMDEIRSEFLHVTFRFVKQYGTLLICKDSVSGITLPGKEKSKQEPIQYLNPVGSPVMAKGGSGDVLTGIIGALICQGLSPEQAAVLGCYLHGKAGQWLEEKTGVYGGLARELADGTAMVMKQLCSLRECR